MKIGKSLTYGDVAMQADRTRSSIRFVARQEVRVGQFVRAVHRVPRGPRWLHWLGLTKDVALAAFVVVHVVPGSFGTEVEGVDVASFEFDMKFHPGEFGWDVATADDQ